MRAAKIGYIVMSVILCALGALFIFLPESTLALLSKLCGSALILFGLIRLAGYFCKDLFRLAFQFDLEFGLLSAVLGIVLIVHPVDVLFFVRIACGVLFFADGLFRIRIAHDARKFGISTWLLLLLLALLTDAAGLLLLIRPAAAPKAQSLMIGLAFLCEGILCLDVALSTVKIIRHQKPDHWQGGE